MDLIMEWHSYRGSDFPALTVGFKQEKRGAASASIDTISFSKEGRTDKVAIALALNVGRSG